jgi:dTDP-4-dehydrorhamnose 3,5-epimerase
VKFTQSTLPGVVIIDPDVHGDQRGFFLETWHERKYREGGIDARFVQDNLSRSGLHTLRGLHAQLHRPQGKLVRVVEGAVFDVAVDIRQGSPHFGRWVGLELSAADQRQLFVPEGFAHGFCVMTESAQFEYKCTDFYDPDDEIAIAWNDPDIGIQWPVDKPRLSPKDVAARCLREFAEHELPVFEPAG